MRTISISPTEADENAYVKLFANALDQANQRVIPFSWRPATLLRSDVIVFHWPSFAFVQTRGLKALKHRLLLLILEILHRVFDKKIIWVAHNTEPHDRAVNLALAAQFTKLLSGVIFLSQSSQKEVSNTYRHILGKPALTIRHGHYLDVACTLASLALPKEFPTLGFVGRIRPYKGVEDLIAACLAQPRVALSVHGKISNVEYGRHLVNMAASAPNIDLHLYDRDLSDLEYERALDSCDGLVLPYRKVLNSGSLLMALSRGRRVLAPRAGSLVEICSQVGSQWIDLYDGEISADVVADFASSLCSVAPDELPDLKAFGWVQIGSAVKGFFDEIDPGKR